MYLITLLAHSIEWLEGANRTRRVGEECVPEPPKPDTLEKEMRKESEQYIEFVICMLPPVYGKEIWSEVAEKTKLSAFVTASQEAFALVLYKNGYETWSWMQSDSPSSSLDGDGIETEQRPKFKYTSRSESHIMARNSGWTLEGLDAFNILYTRVVKDREENVDVFDKALLKYYEEMKIKKRRTVQIEEMGWRKRMRISDYLEVLMAEKLGEDHNQSDDGEIHNVKGL